MSDRTESVRPERPAGPGGVRAATTGDRAAGQDRPDALDAERLRRARERLLIHRLDPPSGGCATCGAACPCPAANEAAAVIVAAGAWNTMTFERPFIPGGLDAHAPRAAGPSSAWARRALRALVASASGRRTAP